MAATNSESWVAALPKAIEAHNSNSHSGILNAAPKDMPKSAQMLLETMEKLGGKFAANSKPGNMFYAYLQK